MAATLYIMEARDQESNLYAYEMAPNPCARGGGVIVDNEAGYFSSIYCTYNYLLRLELKNKLVGRK